VKSGNNFYFFRSNCPPFKIYFFPRLIKKSIDLNDKRLKKMVKFNVNKIGLGRARTPLVFKLSLMGEKVALIEKEHLGETCTNVGCTLTKADVANSRRMRDATQGDKLRIYKPAGVRADLKKLMTYY